MLDRKRAPVPARMLNRILNADIRVSTSCSRFSKKFPVISQKVAQKTIENWFCKESCSKVAQKNKNLFIFGLMLKYANCTTYMNKILLNINRAILRRNQFC